MLSKFMRSAASHQKGETAQRLKSAAAEVQKEVDKGLEPLAKTCPYPPKPGAEKAQADPKLRAKQAALMQSAGQMRRSALRKLEPVVFGHLGLNPEQRQAASLKAGSSKANKDALRAMLKSPDATMRTLGALATRRSGDAALADTLAENLDSPDPVEARATLSALQSVKPDNLVGMLKEQSAKMEAAARVADDGSLGNDGIGAQLHSWARR
jgi:hypothetical protein